MISGIFIQHIDWRGVVVEISYEPNWMGGLTEAFGEPLDHRQIRSVSPERAALPVTESGYRSAFIAGSVITLDGGPVAFVRDWLDKAANDPSWKSRQDVARQLALF